MPRVTTVKSARKDYPEFGIKKGDTYYKWAFAFGPKYKSKTYPNRRQLTRSDFLIGLYGLEDTQSALEADESLADNLQSLIDEINSFADEQEEKKDNMPEGLQDGEVGQLLEERAEGLRDWANELENVIVEVDEEAIKEQAKTEVEGEIAEGNEPTDTELEEAINERFEELKFEKYAEILEEIQNISHSL